MAKLPKITPTLNPNISLNDESDDENKNDHNYVVHKLGIVHVSLRGSGNARAKLEYLMDIV